MLRVLVTGGAGFVGSALCSALVERGAKVFSLDNYFTGTTDNHHEGVKYIAGDARDIAQLAPEGLDVIFHLGEYSRVEQSFEDISLVWEYNRNGITAVLEYCRLNHIKLVYAGSSTKYGDGGLGRTQSPYAWSKASNTELVNCYGSWFGLNYAITYFYNVYGNHEIAFGKYATVIGVFREKMRQGKSLAVVLPGTQVRNFTHIDDIVSGLILVGQKGVGDEFGIGSDVAYSINEVAMMFGGDVEFIPHRKGNRMEAEVHCNRTKELGWECRNELPDYIEALRSRGWNASLI